jgi:hypothetical protein
VLLLHRMELFTQALTSAFIILAPIFNIAFLPGTRLRRARSKSREGITGRNLTKGMGYACVCFISDCHLTDRQKSSSSRVYHVLRLAEYYSDKT